MTRVSRAPLTPEHVRSAAFASARLGRRGLDEGEVRAFCARLSDEISRLRSDNTMLQEEVLRLRGRLLDRTGKPGIRPEDSHIQAVYLLSKAQQTADRHVADAQEYSRELAEDARLRHDEILREAKVRASIILEEAHTSASKAASAARDTHDAHDTTERHDLHVEIAYLRTFSDVCRTHLRAYLESLARSIEQWERAEQEGASAARTSVLRSARPDGSQRAVSQPARD
jgi:DivIVA domain-containing protein